MSEVALGVGYSFNLFHEEDVSHIDFKETGVKLSVDGNIYILHKATTYNESRKVDSLLDSNGEMRVSDYSY